MDSACKSACLALVTSIGHPEGRQIIDMMTIRRMRHGGLCGNLTAVLRSVSEKLKLCQSSASQTVACKIYMYGRNMAMVVFSGNWLCDLLEERTLLGVTTATRTPDIKAYKQLSRSHFHNRTVFIRHERQIFFTAHCAARPQGVWWP